MSRWRPWRGPVASPAPQPPVQAPARGAAEPGPADAAPAAPAALPANVASLDGLRDGALELAARIFGEQDAPNPPEIAALCAEVAEALRGELVRRKLDRGAPRTIEFGPGVAQWEKLQFAGYLTAVIRTAGEAAPQLIAEHGALKAAAIGVDLAALLARLRAAALAGV